MSAAQRVRRDSKRLPYSLCVRIVMWPPGNVSTTKCSDVSQCAPGSRYRSLPGGDRKARSLAFAAPRAQRTETESTPVTRPTICQACLFVVSRC